jgi:hypothetical protein
MRIERSRVARRSVRRCWCLHSADKDNRRSGSRARAGRRAASRAELNRESFATRDGTARLATGNRIGRARCRRSPRPRRHRPADERDRANRPSRRGVCRRKQGPCQRRRQVAVRAYATTKFGLSSASAAPGRAAIRCSAPRVRCSPRRRAAVRSRVPQRRRGKSEARTALLVGRFVRIDFSSVSILARSWATRLAEPETSTPAAATTPPCFRPLPGPRRPPRAGRSSGSGSECASSAGLRESDSSPGQAACRFTALSHVGCLPGRCRHFRSEPVTV